MPLGDPRRAPMDLTRAQASHEGTYQACSASSYEWGRWTGRQPQDSKLATALAQAHWNFPRWLPTWVFFWSLHAGILCL